MLCGEDGGFGELRGNEVSKFLNFDGVSDALVVLSPRTRLAAIAGEEVILIV